MLDRLKNFVKKYQYEIILIGGTAALGGIATYYGYKIGKEIGYSKGYDYGAGDTMVNVSTGRLAGCTFNGKTYEFISKETTEEALLASDPNIEFNPGIAASKIPSAQ